MEIVTRYSFDLLEIENTWKTISVRSKVEKWVVDGENEMLVDANTAFHRITLTPGDWQGAEAWDVTDYATVAWTQEVIDAWNSRIAPVEEQAPPVEEQAPPVP